MATSGTTQVSGQGTYCVDCNIGMAVTAGGGDVPDGFRSVKYDDWKKE